MADSVFINLRAAVHQGSEGKSVAFPDVCLCPPGPPAGPVPTPLPNTVQAADLAGAARTVLISGTPTGKRSSYFATSTGNEVAGPTGGGVVSHTVQGKAHFQTFSPNVFIEGEPAVRHLDLLTHNHLAQPGNTPPAPWISTMTQAGAGAGPKNLSKRAPKIEGAVNITILVLDELGKSVGTALKVTTPKNQRIETRLLWGGSITVTKLAEGHCRLELPEVDNLCRRYKRTRPPAAKEGAAPYQPGRPLELATGKTHRVIVPAFRTLWIEIPVIADDNAITEQKFILSGDGGYRITKTVAMDELEEARRAAEDQDDEVIVGLSFPGLSAGSTFTLTRQPPKGPGEPLFSAKTFEDLFPEVADDSDEHQAIFEQASRHVGDGDE